MSATFLALGLGLVAALQQPDDATRALFITNCAPCHGESGDGQGSTQLDRPARSFADGGFSFGNTEEALLRTISTGIPGTPMPGFDQTLDEGQRRALAQLVRALGPPTDDVETLGSQLDVHERPLVVRGKLPPIAEETDEHPRGLLIGTPGGLTFQYRTDDVRLLGVRLGDFVQRTDWGGRGGSALEPLGVPVFLCEGGAPRASFERPGAGDLLAKLSGSFVRGREAGLTYRLLEADGRVVATVTERVDALSTSVGSGFARHFRIESTGEAFPLLAHVVHPPDDATQPAWRDAKTLAFPAEGGVLRTILLEGDGVLARDRVHLSLEPGRALAFTLGVVTTLDHAAPTLERLRAEAGLAR